MRTACNACCCWPCALARGAAMGMWLLLVLAAIFASSIERALDKRYGPPMPPPTIMVPVPPAPSMEV